MEKSTYKESPARRRTRAFLPPLAILALVVWSFYPYRGVDEAFWFDQDELTSQKPFRWSNITPSTSLQFHACYEEYECARLDVPLDWTALPKEQSKQRAAVAITRLKAKVPVSSKNYGGAILLNPGGPGGSGINFVTKIGPSIQTIVETGKSPKPHFSSSNKAKTGLHYDIIGFDPRGVNNTTPYTSCFPDDASRQFWQVQNEAQGILSLNDTFPAVWGRTQAVARGCSERLKKEGVGVYMNTPVVVKDMVAIIEALGELREKEGKALVSSRKVGCKRGERKDVLERTKWMKGEEKLLYWGFSYGTLLGATFAAMYPDRVGRVVLDGVVDAEDYYAGTWLTNLLDTDSIISSFISQCYAAGPEKCHLYSSDGIKEIRKTFDNVLSDLFPNPIPVSGTDNYGPDLITRTDAMSYVKNALYSPMPYFKPLARVFHALSLGNGTELSALKQSSRQIFCRDPLCEGNPYTDACYKSTSPTFRSEVSAAVLCTDASPSLLNWTAKDHFNKWHALREQSEYLGDYWTEITMFCASWNLRPSYTFVNPNISSSHTANPILFASNTRDPVTPLRNARTMQKSFGGSGLLVQEGDGHCTISAPGTCAAERIRAYFQEGVLPEEGVVCEADGGPFDDVEEVVWGMGVEEKEVFEAVRKIGEEFGRGRGSPFSWL